MNISPCYNIYEPRQSAHILESLETKNVHRQIKPSYPFLGHIWEFFSARHKLQPGVLGTEQQLRIRRIGIGSKILPLMSTISTPDKDPQGRNI